MPELAPELWIAALAVAFLAGVVKGVVGFAMPMIMISGLGSLLPPDVALAALIVPTVITNVFQALRTGLAPAVASARTHWRYLVIAFVGIAISAQLVQLLPAEALFLLVGLPVIGFSLAQLAGWQLRLVAASRRKAEIAIGAFAGFLGGVSGVWGPPTVMYLTALDTPKVEQVRVQGVVYGAGAVVLLFAHLASGVFNASTAPLSVALLPPAVLGLWLGFRVQDRLDQALFKRATLVVLVVAGLNLVRRGVFG